MVAGTSCGVFHMVDCMQGQVKCRFDCTSSWRPVFRVQGLGPKPYVQAKSSVQPAWAI